MDQETMVTNLLSEKRIEKGEELLRALESNSIKPIAALWFYYEDSESWKLLIALPDYAQNGPLASYREIQKVLPKPENSDGLTLNDISVINPEAPLIELLKRSIKVANGFSRIRFTKNVIDGQYIDDALIYRLG